MKLSLTISKLLSSRIIHCAASTICIVFLCASITGCGGGGTDSNLQAGGGSGGTGLYTPSSVSIGTVSDAQRMEVNDIRFNTQQADVYIEGQYVGNGDEAVRRNVKYGYLSKVSGEIYNDTSGIADRVEIFHMVRGPLESATISGPQSFELQVMGQTVLGSTNTKLEGFDINTLQIGALLCVSGIIDGQGVIHAGHIVKASDECAADSTVMVKGIVSNLDLQQKTFSINDLKIDFSEADLQHFPKDGNSIWVNGHFGPDGLKAKLVREFSSLNVQGADQFALEGFFTSRVASDQWRMGNYLVQISDSTILEGNTLEEISVGRHVRVYGVLDNFTIHASKIVFYQEVEVQSHVTRIDHANRTLELAGVSDVTVRADDNTALLEAGGQKTLSLESFGSAPYWVRIDRQGDEFNAYKRSDTSSQWIPLGSATFGMVRNAYIGLCVAAGDEEMLNKAVFDNVNVNASKDTAWLSQDIGPLERTGSTRIEGDRYTIQASGKGILSRADGFRYVYKPLNGDGSIEARVVQLSNTATSAKAGLMIRESLASDSPAVSVTVTPENGIAFQWRQPDTLQSTVFENLEIGTVVKIRGDFDNIDLVNAASIELYDSIEYEEEAYGEEEQETEGSPSGFYIYGPVKAPAMPFLTILGTTFDTSGYQFYEVDGDCSKCLKQELSPQAFFDALSPNSMVKLYGTKHEGRTVYEGILLFNNPDCHSCCGW
jgi:hypothetical protein